MNGRGWSSHAAPTLVIGPSAAKSLAQLARIARRQIESPANGGARLDPAVAELLAELDRVAAGAAPEVPEPPDPAPVSEWVGTSDAAVMLGVSDRQVRNYVASGRLSGRRDGRALLVALDEVEGMAYRKCGSVPESAA